MMDDDQIARLYQLWIETSDREQYAAIGERLAELVPGLLERARRAEEALGVETTLAQAARGRFIRMESDFALITRERDGARGVVAALRSERDHLAKESLACQCVSCVYHRTEHR